MSYLKQINWLDILALILLIRVSYIAIKTGFPTEIFKLLGTVLAIYLACHYYIKASIFLNNYIPLKSEAGISFLNSLTFFSLAFLGYIIFVAIRIAFTVLIKMETNSLLNHWGALIFGIGRFCLFASLLFFTITISNINYLEKSLSNSFIGPKLVKLAPRVYTSLWDNLMSRFMDKGEFNQQVF